MSFLFYVLSSWFDMVIVHAKMLTQTKIKWSTSTRPRHELWPVQKKKKKISTREHWNESVKVQNIGMSASPWYWCSIPNFESNRKRVEIANYFPGIFVFFFSISFRNIRDAHSFVSLSCGFLSSFNRGCGRGRGRGHAHARGIHKQKQNKKRLTMTKISFWMTLKWKKTVYGLKKKENKQNDQTNTKPMLGP